MTTELEQEFFKVFEIEKKCQCKNFLNYADCFRIHTECEEYSYPEITDRKLLEMICILSAYNYIFEDLKADDIEQLKEEIIKLFFDYPLIAEEEKTNIQQLFKEGE